MAIGIGVVVDIALSNIEKEIIVLKAISDSIDAAVNFEVMQLIGDDPNSEIRFQSQTHQKFFFIVLVDLLSRPRPDPFGIGPPYANLHNEICRNPGFNRDGSVGGLVRATNLFHAWLQEEVCVKGVWLPAIETQLDLSIRREEFIRICGDISKHNFTRLVRRAKNIQKILLRNKINLDLPQSILALDDFYEWFHGDVLLYHSSTIAEFLNNIRWGLYEYLLPEFTASIVYEEPPMYRFTFPKDVASVLAKNCYWALMNNMRSAPYMRQFEVTKYLKMHH